MQELVTVTYARYRTPDGEPTCAVDFTDGRYCPFYREQNTGFRETCILCPDTEIDRQGMHTRLIRRPGKGKGLGYLVPGTWCPLWP